MYLYKSIQVCARVCVCIYIHIYKHTHTYIRNTDKKITMYPFATNK